MRLLPELKQAGAAEAKTLLHVPWGLQSFVAVMFGMAGMPELIGPVMVANI